MDDEPRVLAALRRNLGNRFIIVCANSGAEALTLLDSYGPFAVVVSDMRMPGMSGLEFLREMRQRVPSVVRLILTGHADFDILMAALNDNAVFRFHTKPVTAEALTASIELAMLRHHNELRVRRPIDPGEALVHKAAELRRALRSNELRIYIQPQGRLDGGGICGGEALVRWMHPERGLLPPYQFLGVADAMGLMEDLTAWMLDAACVEARRWSDLHLHSLRIAVNVTAIDLANPEFASQVSKTLTRHGVAPQVLELEPTEGEAIADMRGTQSTLRELEQLGVSFNMDDFGMGHSSLGWLRTLPVSKLKIDRLFIRDITTDPEAYQLLCGIVALAEEMQLTVLAEGVETAAQLELVTQAGCKLVQGYLLARPMPASEFVDWLAAQGAA
ncbi:MAG TPA: EAL domain-containing protein [Patescibacteria group bacterium]|nr:EAL domain-containing protein [Patescibacteria group bacterium]